MADTTAGYRLYGELASWWPLISPCEEYAEEAAFVAGLLGSGPPPVTGVLELGSGGGHVAAHLKAHFTMTLVDISAGMLEASRRLNPQCEHRQGDMRTVRLGRLFDAVLVHDAVDYMLSEAEVTRVAETAFAHCRPGGTAVFVPDHVAETFQPGTGYGGSDEPDGRGARFLEWRWDPDPADSWTQTDYAFLLRDADGSMRAVHESHRMGLFGRAVWPRLLAAAGFEARTVTEQTSELRTPRELFVAHRP